VVAGEGVKDQGYDKNQRAYVLTATGAQPPVKVELKLAGREQSPVLNPALVIKNWGQTDVKLTLDDRELSRGKDFRMGHVPTLEGTDLVLWVKCEALKPVTIIISRSPAPT